MQVTAGEARAQGRANVTQQAETYLHQLFVDAKGSEEDVSEAMDDKDGWHERVKKPYAASVTWWMIYIKI